MPHHQPSLPADAISTAVMPWLSPAVRSWLPSDNPTAPVTEWLAEEVWRIDNAEFAGQLDAAIPVTVSDPMLWANRVLDGRAQHADQLWTAGSEGTPWILAASRARDQDIDRSYVDIIATDLPPSLATFAVLADPESGPLHYFEEFNPRCVRVFVADPESTATAINDSGLGLRADIDTLLLAGPIDTTGTGQATGSKKAHDGTQLTASLTTSERAQLQLVPAHAAEAAEGISAIYDAIEREVPSLRWWARPSDEHELEECEEAGLLFALQATEDSAQPELPSASCPEGIVGFIAARPNNAFGLTGWEMVEKCIHPSHQGNNYSALATALLTQCLRSSDIPTAPGDSSGRATPVLWGEIDPANRPSLGTANKVGRTIVGGHLWLTPAGFPGMN